MGRKRHKNAANTISGGNIYGPVVQGRRITVGHSPPATPALRGLPPATPTFTGREPELHLLLDLLDPSSAGAGPVTAMVAGLAGVGKTELAVQAAHTAQTRGWFPGGVIFVDLHGYDTARQVPLAGALEGMLRALGFTAAQIAADAEGRARQYASTLAELAERGQRLLVVVDNASSAEQVRPLLPADGTNRAVITSRHTIGGVDARLLELPVLPPDGSVDLLARALRVARGAEDSRLRDDPAAARTLAKLCGNLPLALHIVAALLADDPSRNPSSMADDLADAHARLDELEREDRAVRAAFHLSYRHLSPPHARLFRLLTVNPGPETSTEAAAAIADLDVRPARRDLEALARAHMVERGSAYGRWRMHDLIRLYADEQRIRRTSVSGNDLVHTCADTEDSDEAFNRLLRYYTSTAERHSRAVYDRPAFPAPSAREEALAWLDVERPNLVASIAAAHRSARWHETYALTRAITQYFEYRHHCDDGLRTHELALEAAEHLGPAELCWAENRLGNACRIAHRYDDGVRHLQRALQIAETDGLNRIRGAILHNLGLTYFRKGEHIKAASCHRKDLKICSATGDVSGMAQTLVALGDAYRALGHLAQADNCLRLAKETFALLADPDGSAGAFSNHGLTFLAANQPLRSLIELSKGLKLARDSGNRHGEALDAMNIGIAYMTRCVYCYRDSAIHWLQLATTLAHELGDQYLQAKALRNLARAYLVSGEVQRARKNWQQALSILNSLGLPEAEEVQGELAHLSGNTTTIKVGCSKPEEKRIHELFKRVPYRVLRGDPMEIRQFGGVWLLESSED
ncbi:ATP-binding protein [Micromonospora wenchangensis]|uniref:ATP-binding protein n=1 Tax=Micromonospora wenchangensis TaxID=1185415 RepID=UPI0037F710FC